MTKTRVIIADHHEEIEAKINELLATLTCRNVRFLQIVGGGEANYAVLVAWEE